MLIFFKVVLTSSRFFLNKLSNLDLSTEVEIICLTESIAILIEVFFTSLPYLQQLAMDFTLHKRTGVEL